MDIDKVIAEATASAPAPVVENQDAPKVEATEAATEETEAKTEEAKPEVKTEQPFPKKAINTIARLKSDRWKLQQELKQFRQKQTTEAQAPKISPPREEDFEGKPIGEYLDAKAEYAAEKKIQEREAKLAEEKEESDAQAWEEERQELIDESANKAKEAFSDFEQLVEKHATAPGKDGGKPVIPLSPAARSALLESDNGAFALYSIMKDGLLGELNDLSLAKAAMMVARHEDKGIALSKTKLVTKAPTPMSPAKGAATGGKQLDAMSWQEQKAWLQS